MSKAAALAAAGAGGTAIAVGGAYMLGGFSSKSSGEKSLEIPDSLSEFQNKDKGAPLVNDYFPGIAWGSDAEGTEWNGNNKPDSSNFPGNADDNRRARLVVNWEKFKCSPSPEDSDKFVGKIRWLWSFVNGDKGLVLYAAAKSSSSEASKLDVEGIIYAIEKEGTDNNKVWKIKYHKKASTTNTTVDAWANKLPEVGDKLKTNLQVKEYWGFTDVTNQLTKLCKLETNQNLGTPTNQFKGSWTWKKEENKDEKSLAWSKDGHQWLEFFYGATDPKLETLVQNLTGAWTEEKFENKQSGVGS